MNDIVVPPRCRFHGGVMGPAWAGRGLYWSAPCCPLIIPRGGIE